MEWLKKHVDAVMVIGAIFSSMIWMNGKFNDLEKDMVVMKTVLLMKEIVPSEVFTTNLDFNKKGS
jgi:hypothetical protein